MSGLHTLYHTLSNTEARIKQPQCQMGLSLLSQPHSQTLCTCKHWFLKIWLKYYTHTKLEANWWQWQLMGASCSLLHSHDKKEDWTKKRRMSDDDSAAEKAGFAVIKTHPRVLLSLIYFCFSVSSNHTFFSIWLSSQFNQSPDKMLGVCCSFPGM